jgi:predicted Ser/Thr protein kinase/outer membrane biosynthesis protein TonB
MPQSETIGKYQILERIGRGGMGMIFKAHDPVLNRPVALKVISTEVEVTDELRARFFREAQACARLSHPNIVTVYDMGEDDGRLFIVMELLEGEELKRVVARKKALALEDKLAIMAQVCDGLHYAHQRGIVHRDIKPGNIFVLQSGQVKILDFGIAQMADTEAGLTRTGLIMGTLRYISPEQVRGRADHRSDIYSVGAVFYELLSMRPPFTGDDPMHLLEQLRTDEPPPLEQLDPAIPSELASTVARALRKDPAERFADLEQMRFQIEDVQRQLTEEALRLGARVRDQRARLLELRAALAQRLGPSTDDDVIPSITERARLATVQALERDFAGRIEALQSRISRADSLAPALQRATDLLRAGRGADAVEAFEAIVAQMPEHARALDGLREARAEVEAERRRQFAARLVRDARAAIEAAEYSRCLEILKQAEEIPPPAEAIQEIVSLREMAAAAHEAARRARQQAEALRAQMIEARRAAQTLAEVQQAPVLWYEAEARSTEAEVAFARASYAEAGQAFDAAAAAYRRFEEAARHTQRRERDAAERAREQATLGRRRARDEDALRYAREQWDTAEATFEEALAAFARGAMGRAATIFSEALAAYGRATEAAREALQRERQRVEEAREQEAGAQATGGPSNLHELQDTAVATRVIEAIPGRADARDGTRVGSAGPDAGEPRSRRFRGLAADVPIRERGGRWTPWVRGIVIVLGGLAVIVTGISYWPSTRIPPGPPGKPSVTATAPQPATSASSGSGGVRAGQQEQPKPTAEQPKPTAEQPKPTAEQPKPTAEQPKPTPPEQPKPTAEQPKPAGDESAGVSGDRPPPQGSAALLAPESKGEAPKTEPDRPVLPAPRRTEERGAESRPAQDRREAEQAVAQLASARRGAEQAAAAFYAPGLLASAQARERESTDALARADYGSAVRLLAEARSGYQAAAQEARREADEQRRIAPLRASTEQARAATMARRRQALAADAERLAGDLLHAAEAKHAEADRLAKDQSFVAAATAYDEAAERYTEAALKAQAATGAR